MPVIESLKHKQEVRPEDITDAEVADTPLAIAGQPRAQLEQLQITMTQSLERLRNSAASEVTTKAVENLRQMKTLVEERLKAVRQQETAASSSPSMTASLGKMGSSVGTLVGASSDLAESATVPISKIPVLNALFVFFGISGIAATGKSIYNWFTGTGKKKKKNK